MFSPFFRRNGSDESRKRGRHGNEDEAVLGIRCARVGKKAHDSFKINDYQQSDKQNIRTQHRPNITNAENLRKQQRSRINIERTRQHAAGEPRNVCKFIHAQQMRFKTLKVVDSEQRHKKIAELRVSERKAYRKLCSRADGSGD